MSKEEELMKFLHVKVFKPILDSKTVSPKIKNGVRLTVSRMNRLSEEKMVQYFWSALMIENGIKFSKELKLEGVTRFEDIMEEFRDKFNDRWIRS